jgi:hypothetical protein
VYRLAGIPDVMGKIGFVGGGSSGRSHSQTCWPLLDLNDAGLIAGRPCLKSYPAEFVGVDLGQPGPTSVIKKKAESNNPAKKRG